MFIILCCNDIGCDRYDTLNGIHDKFLEYESMLVCLLFL